MFCNGGSVFFEDVLPVLLFCQGFGPFGPFGPFLPVFWAHTDFFELFEPVNCF